MIYRYCAPLTTWIGLMVRTSHHGLLDDVGLADLRPDTVQLTGDGRHLVPGEYVELLVVFDEATRLAFPMRVVSAGVGRLDLGMAMLGRGDRRCLAQLLGPYKPSHGLGDSFALARLAERRPELR